MLYNLKTSINLFQAAKCANLTRNLASPTRILARKSSSSSDYTLKKQDPNNYKIPLRMPTIDDRMEPYGDWNVAYERERRYGNICLIRGALCLGFSFWLLIYSGSLDEIWMPNLDNIIADTEPYKRKPEIEGRVTPYNLDDDDEEEDGSEEDDE